MSTECERRLSYLNTLSYSLRRYYLNQEARPFKLQITRRTFVPIKQAVLLKCLLGPFAAVVSDRLRLISALRNLVVTPAVIRFTNTGAGA